MKMLLDTNIIAEFLLDQNKADQVEGLLKTVPLEECYLSAFTLDSMGVLLVRRKMHNVFLRAIDDLVVRGGAQIISLEIGDMKRVMEAASTFTLDFDDAYQCVAAEKYNLTLVSFDADFDRTERGRKTPAQILETL